MLGVLAERRRRRRNAERLLADRNVDPEPAERRVQALVEGRDREPVVERERLELPAVGPDDEPVVDEVEVDLEGHAGRRVHPARRQPAHVDVERDVPPVVARGGRGHPHLADDLRPQVQRVLRRLPLLERERRELPLRPHGVSPGADQSARSDATTAKATAVTGTAR